MASSGREQDVSLCAVDMIEANNGAGQGSVRKQRKLNKRSRLDE